MALGLYFFHLHEGSEMIADEEGREYESLNHAVLAALCDARSILCEDVQCGRLDLSRTLSIEDMTGTIYHRLHFAHALEIIVPSQSH